MLIFLEMKKLTITVFIDGLCEPTNPGGVATYGLTIYIDGFKTYEESEFLGEGSGMSNNVAEYQALCMALKLLLDKGLNNKEIVVKSDSRLIVNQMNGYWKCRGGLYSSKYYEAQSLVKSFKKISYVWVPREENNEADKLTRLALQKFFSFREKT